VSELKLAGLGGYGRRKEQLS